MTIHPLSISKLPFCIMTYFHYDVTSPGNTRVIMRLTSHIPKRLPSHIIKRLAPIYLPIDVDVNSFTPRMV